MATEPSFRLILIVTGSSLRAEEMDRPLAYYLQQRIEAVLRGESIKPTGSKSRSRSKARPESAPDVSDYEVRVVADFRWLNEEFLQGLPTISLGGPGVNALARRWLEEVPIALNVNERYFIQMDPDLTEPHVSIWGMDNPTTQIAVSVFLDRYLSRFLERCASIPATLIEVDDEGDDEADMDPDDD
jgi:hypothetical protein